MLINFVRSEYGTQAADDRAPVSRFGMLRDALSQTTPLPPQRRR